MFHPTSPQHPALHPASVRNAVGFCGRSYTEALLAPLSWYTKQRAPGRHSLYGNDSPSLGSGSCVGLLEDPSVFRAETPVRAAKSDTSYLIPFLPAPKPLPLYLHSTSCGMATARPACQLLPMSHTQHHWLVWVLRPRHLDQPWTMIALVSPLWGLQV